MTRINGWCLSVLLCVTVIGTSVEDARAQGGGDPLTRLRERYPWAKSYEEGGVTRAVFGRAMTCAARPADAAQAFLAEHGEVFADDLDLEPLFVARVKGGSKAVFGYRQHVEGLPVEGSVARIVAHDTGRAGSDRWAVVSAAGYIANPTVPLPERLLNGSQALTIALQDARAAGLTQWGEPTECLWWERSAGQRATTRAWKVDGTSAGGHAGSWSFYVNVRTGQVVHAENNVLHAGAP